jgi:hypothetical protein
LKKVFFQTFDTLYIKTHTRSSDALGLPPSSQIARNVHPLWPPLCIHTAFLCGYSNCACLQYCDLEEGTPYAPVHTSLPRRPLRLRRTLIRCCLEKRRRPPPLLSASVISSIPRAAPPDSCWGSITHTLLVRAAVGGLILCFFLVLCTGRARHRHLQLTSDLLIIRAAHPSLTISLGGVVKSLLAPPPARLHTYITPALKMLALQLIAESTYRSEPLQDALLSGNYSHITIPSMPYSQSNTPICILITFYFIWLCFEQRS